MRYALVVYDVPDSWHGRPSQERHAIHSEYHALAVSAGVLAHYRLAAPQRATTVRLTDGQTLTTAGPDANASETLRAFYLVESDDHEHVLEVAAQIPAARMGGVVEVWPLADPPPESASAHGPG